MSGVHRQPLHSHDLGPFQHSHAFGDAGQARRERALTWVTQLTLVTMVVELVAGWWTASLALTADGWHMGTHALALGGAVLAYRLSQRAAGRRAVAGGSAGYAFGGWKIEVLAAYTSGLALMAVALWLVWEGVSTLLAPRAVSYREAMAVAVIGLVVNVASMWLLSRAGQAHSHGPVHPQDQGHVHPHAQPHEHEHEHEHHHEHGHEHEPGHAHEHRAAHASPAARARPHAHHDHNFSAAYLHVLADALTSVLAIGALAGGAWFGLAWLDPAVALLGAALIGQWAWRMLRQTATALVDATEDPALTERVRSLIESDGDAQLADLHVWQVGAQAWSATLSVVADAPLPAAAYRQRLAGVAQIRHVTVEVHRCVGGAASPP